MHIIFNSDEKDLVLQYNLPDGTTLAEESSKPGKFGIHKILFRHEIQNGGLITKIDFKEHERKFTKKELEEFINNHSIGDAIKILLEYHSTGDEYKIPYRIITACQNIYRKHYNHTELISIEDENDDNNLIPTFKVTVNRNSNLDNVIKEVEYIYSLVKRDKPLYVDIFEHTCSQYGCYHLMVSDDKIRLRVTTYGRDRGIEEFSNWRDTLAYIQKNHYYQ